ncbi:MAG: spore germination protein GerW family protein [Ginsengibacter sp.]
MAYFTYFEINIANEARAIRKCSHIAIFGHELLKNFYLQTLNYYYMENVNFIENLAARLGENASVKNVYGEPVIANGKTIIPVAQVAIGFGGGYGEKKKKKSYPENLQNEAIFNKKEPGGEGAGGGGGMYAKAKGVYEISDDGTRFIPANNNKHLLIAVLVGFAIRGWFSKRKKNKFSH